MNAAEALLPYRVPRAAKSNVGSHVEGEVYDVSSAGMRFTVPAWDGGKYLFGPAPWPLSQVEPINDGGDGAATHDHAGTSPARGARCLVFFVGGGIDRPWVLGVWP
jgi:hypothetical protein